MKAFASDLFSGVTAIALLTGAVAVQMLPALPPRLVTMTLACAAVSLLIVAPRWRWLGFALLGAAWTIWRADLALAQRLPTEFEGRDFVVTGTVRGLPRVQDDSTRFELSIEDARIGQGSIEQVSIEDASGRAPLPLRGTLRVSWHDDAPTVQPCERWQLHLRLKRPRGIVDPGAFDFERYALEQGIVATGYVREDAANRVLGERLPCVDRLRAHISQGIADTLGPGPAADLLRALAFGDQQAMNDHEWAVARATGIPHLIAISGLHIALFAGFGVLLTRGFWRLVPRLTLRWPAPQIEAIASILCALAYGTIAGLGLPTRRALVMIGVLLAATLARRSRSPSHGLAFATIVLLAIDPACVLSAGFWLSFVGVAWLMFCLGARAESRHGWRELVHAQGVASIGLLPLTIWFFGQSSLIGPVANLVAVPAICFFILPVTVLGALLQLVVPAAGALLLHLAGWAMQALWWLLENMATWPWALRYFPEPSMSTLAFAMLGALWLLAPRGVPLRALGLLLFLPLLVPAGEPLADGEFEVLMLDVGQGLSLVVRTREHVLVYDAGARFPSGFDFGEAAVVPVLHALGVDRVDRLVVSHGDNDHAGGAEAVLAAFPASAVVAGEPERLRLPATQCLAGESWRWNDVGFRFVHPHPPLSARDNDRCCVLEIRVGESAVVLTGDITSAVESEIAAALVPVPGHLVLQVPHHGSKTSSAEEFLAALRPQLALVSTGYRNHFHHPSAAVVARYDADDIALLDTAVEGFVRVRFSATALPRVTERGRRDRHPYWRE